MDIQMASIVLQDAARYLAMAAGSTLAHPRPGQEPSEWMVEQALHRLATACDYLEMELVPRKPAEAVESITIIVEEVA